MAGDTLQKACRVNSGCSYRMRQFQDLGLTQVENSSSTVSSVWECHERTGWWVIWCRQFSDSRRMSSINSEVGGFPDTWLPPGAGAAAHSGLDITIRSRNSVDIPLSELNSCSQWLPSFLGPQEVLYRVNIFPVPKTCTGLSHFCSNPKKRTCTT